MSNSLHLEQCRTFIAKCNEELRWLLDAAMCEQYAVALAPVLESVAEEKWKTIAGNYREDHGIVEALFHKHHPEHDQAWLNWSTQAMRVLRRENLDWTRDPMMSSEDMAQHACGEIVKALPSFRYQSRFSSWAYSVIVRSAQRQVRTAKAQRRTAHVESIHELEEYAIPTDSHNHHEQIAEGHILAQRVSVVLRQHPDPRLLQIFQLWAVEDRTSAEIGVQVNLHESRVRALLKQARTVLQAHSDLQQWLNSAKNSDDADEHGIAIG